MTRDQIRIELNHRLRNILHRARVTYGEDFLKTTWNQDSGITDFDRRRIEMSPADVPCHQLYQLVKIYGRQIQLEIEAAFIDVQFLKFSAFQAKLGTAPSGCPRLPKNSSSCHLNPTI